MKSNWKILKKTYLSIRFLRMVFSKNRRLIVFLGLISLVFSPIDQLRSQGFNAAVVGGINASQIDGDDLAGFNKLGLHGGLKLGYFIKPKLNLSTELLLSQRGSSSSLSIGSPVEQITIQLNYIEIPVMISFHDWLFEENYYKVRADIGLSYGNLFSASSENSFFDDNVDVFKTNDFSMLAGIAYQFNRHLALNMRYTRSVIPLFENPSQLVRGLYGYFVTFRLEYHF